MATKNKLPLTKPTKRQCRYKFNDEELLALGKELAEANGQLTALEEDKKRVVSDFTAKVAAKEADVSIGVNKIQSGYEWRELPCTITFNSPVPGKKTVVRDDTQEQVAIENMTQDELQTDLKLEENDIGGAAKKFGTT